MPDNINIPEPQRYDHMLIDGRNAMYRAIYAGLSDEQFVYSKHDFIVVFFRFVSTYLNKFRATNVHFFWDAPKSTLWRKTLWTDYKEGRDQTHGGKYNVDMEALLQRNTDICTELVAAMNCRNYIRAKQEADDLIYAFCRYVPSDRIVIVSSDGDFKQIPFAMRTVDLFNPMNKANGMVEVPQLDPVDIKSFMGERGDNIIGYPKIGPKTAEKIVRDLKRRHRLFVDYGRKTYLRNRALIDLSMCPFLLANIGYIIKQMSVGTRYDDERIREIIQKYKVKGLSGEIKRTLLPFKFLGG